VDRIQFMRKTVIDGSNVSGFQRTALVGMDGYVEVDGKKFGVETVCLEEEACQVIERKEDHDIYNLSRLGIPLIEIATAPDMKTPEEARDVAAKIGMILRSTDACKRGIGSIRQDVNLSIKGGARIEIKGFQELKSIPKVIEYEVKRHADILKSKKKMQAEVRKAEPDFTTSFLRPMPGQDRMYPETDIPEITPNVKGLELVKTIEQKIDDLMKEHKLAKELATQAVKAGIDLGSYVKKYAKLEPKFIADTLLNAPKEIKARFGKEIDALTHADELFEKVNSGELPKGAVFEILSEIAHGKKPDFSKYKGLSPEELENEIIELVKKEKDATIQALMGVIMGKHRGKVDGKTVMSLLQKHKK
ncbi:hypothetical protein JW711_00470, partial [Candidatus Woesearchaeota archaeon]|nr:hypothetical protein [Candidatus Woesearchaeota archaeon]